MPPLYRTGIRVGKDIALTVFRSQMWYTAALMRDDIVHKLADTMASGIDSECKVVYLLCEVRKLLEKHPPDPMPPALKLYCHWALHVDLKVPNTTLAFLKRVDEFVGSAYGTEPRDDAAEQRMYHELHIFAALKDELRSFLAGYGLPTDLCDDSVRWRLFLQHYAGVIEDGTLSCSAKTGELKYVRKVVFSKGPPITWPKGVEMFLPFDLTWDILLLDTQKLTVSTNARISESGQRLMDSSLSLN